MPRKKLTALGVERLKLPKKGQVDYFDASYPGFGVRVSYRGTKSYFVMTRIHDFVSGKDKVIRVTLGQAHRLDLKDARKKATEVLEQVEAGEDPRIKSKRKPRADHAAKPNTFGAILEEYFAKETAHQKRGGEVEQLFRRELVDWWDWKPDEITRQDVKALIGGVAQRGTKAAAARLYRTLKACLNWVANEEYIEFSPMVNFKLPKGLASQPRARVLSLDEIRILWATTEGLDYPIKQLYQLLLATGQRREEIASIQWTELDLDESMWVIPPERCKSERPHAVPLAPLVQSIFDEMPRFGGPYILTTTGGEKPISGFSKAKRNLDKALHSKSEELGLEGFEKPWVVHDLRRTVRSELSRLGVPEIVAERVINHAPVGLNKVYDRYEYLKEKKDALDKWARRLSDLTSPPAANIVPIQRTAAR